MKNLLRFTVIIFSAIVLSALMAHLLSMDVKMKLGKEQYALAQSLYRGWAWLGIFEILTILLLLIWLISERKTYRRFYTLLAALCFFSVSLALFFMYTFPANQQTRNWTELPDSWMILRSRWEYSHAARTCLNLLGFSFLIIHLLIRKTKGSKQRYPKELNV
jgi:hypothetical protein